jgi:hypothetical protein
MKNEDKTDSKAPEPMSQYSSPPIQVVNGEAGKNKGKGKKALLGLVVITLLVGLGGTGYLYAEKMSENKDLNSQINNLKEEVVLSDANQAVSDSASDAPADSGETKFLSKLSNFSLTLPSSYGIAIVRDSGGDGRPFTYVQIGKKDVDGNPYVGENPDYSVYATKYLEKENFGTLLDSSIKDSGAKKLNEVADFDGAKAVVYQLDGSGEPGRKFFFESEDTFYDVTIADDYKRNKEVADDITNGFKFTKP